MKSRTAKVNDENQSPEHVITLALNPLAKKNPEAYKILIALSKESFFEKSQTNTSIRKLTSILLNTIEGEESEDENRFH